MAECVFRDHDTSFQDGNVLKNCFLPLHQAKLEAPLKQRCLKFNRVAEI